MDCFYPRTIKNPKTNCFITVPCRQCIACRINQTSEWSMRLLHEKQYWRDCCFVTLTYDEYNLPDDGACKLHSLHKEHVQEFTHNLHNYLRSQERTFKYFCCGEYGDPNRTFRPHYHLIMFGVGLNDSDLINRAWSKGRVDIGTVTNQSCNYVTGYIQKKLTGKNEFKTYGCRVPPFQLQSQGLGLNYAIEHSPTLSARGLRKNGIKVSIPRYYTKKIDSISDSVAVHVINKRLKNAREELAILSSLNEEKASEFINAKYHPDYQKEQTLKKSLQVHRRQKI